METTPKSNNKKSLIILLFALLAIVIGVLVYLNIQKSGDLDTAKETIVLKDKELNEKLIEMNKLKDDLTGLQAQNEQMGVQNDSLNAQIEQLNTMIKSIKSNQAASTAQRKQLDVAIARLKVERDNYVAEIQVLKAKNDSLNTDVQTLQSEKTKMGESINELGTTNKDLADKVAIASILKVDGIGVSVLTSKGKVIEGDEFKASKIDKLKITFKLADNKVAKQNEKTIYLRIIDPSNAALYDLATGGGMFDFEEKSISYTAKKEITFQNNGADESFIYSKGSEFAKGRHNVELYCEGHKIGGAFFVVK